MVQGVLDRELLLDCVGMERAGHQTAGHALACVSIP
jgi:hypothetical protein